MARTLPSGSGHHPVARVQLGRVSPHPQPRPTLPRPIPHRLRRLPVLLVLLLAVTATGCGRASDNLLPDPRDGRSGLQMSGLLRDRQIAISDGLPILNTTDCDVNEGPDRDVCIIAEDINGELVRLVFENPDVLQEGAVLPVGSDCADPEACDAVTDAAVVEVQFGDREMQRLQSGTLTIEAVVPGARYRGDLDGQLDDGRISATFDVVPRPEELS